MWLTGSDVLEQRWHCLQLIINLTYQAIRKLIKYVEENIIIFVYYIVSLFSDFNLFCINYIFCNRWPLTENSPITKDLNNEKHVLQNEVAFSHAETEMFNHEMLQVYERKKESKIIPNNCNKNIPLNINTVQQLQLGPFQSFPSIKEWLKL